MTIINIIFLTFGNIVCYLNLIWLYKLSTYEKNNVNKYIILLILLFSLISTFLTLYNLTPLKTIFLLITLCYLNLKIYRNKLNQILIYSFLIWLIGMIVDLVFAYLYSKFNVVNVLNLWKMNECISIIIVSFILQFLLNLLFRLKSIKRMLKFMFLAIDNFKKHIVIIVFLIIFLIFLGAYAVNRLYNPEVIVLLFLLSISISLVLALYLVNRQQRNILYNTNNILLENNKFYSELNIESRTFRHNLIHKLDGIKSNGDKYINELIDEIIKECNLISNYNSEIDKIPIGLSGFIYQKIYRYEYKSLNIVVDNYLEDNILSILKPKDYNKLCETLGVILDNSLESCIKSKEKFLYIIISKSAKRLEIVLKNSFSSQLDLDKLGVLEYSTKGNNRGIGLFSIIKNKSVITKFNIMNNVFESKILIKVNKKTKN